MQAALLVALVIHAGMMAFQLWTFKGLKNKKDIVRYYTYLQNALALGVSAVFCVSVVLSFLGIAPVPEWVRGLRYITTTGLCFTAAIYYAVLLPGKDNKNALSEEDFIRGYSPKTANFALHIFCPLCSLVSFAVFERSIPLTASYWTAFAALPSALYWCMYALLSALHLWQEPYTFTEKKGASGVLIFILIPFAYVLISFVLWNIR